MPSPAVMRDAKSNYIGQNPMGWGKTEERLILDNGTDVLSKTNKNHPDNLDDFILVIPSYFIYTNNKKLVGFYKLCTVTV